MKKYEFINSESKNYPILHLCKAAGMSSSAYYKSKENKISQRSKDDEYYKSEILKIHQKSRNRYGHRPMHIHLKEQGVSCGRDRTRRLMKELSIQPKSKKGFKPQATDSNHEYGYKPNLLKGQEKEKMRKDSVWVADTTYIRRGFGWVYLAVIMDLHTRRVIGWSVSEQNNTTLVLKALKNAILTRGKEIKGTIHHCDRGSTYASHLYQDLLKKYGLRSSMSAKGNCYDNAAMESFFGRYKTSSISNWNFDSKGEVQKHVFDYIEIFYNRYRKHSSLGYMSPIQFEEKNSPSRGKIVKESLLNN